MDALLDDRIPIVSFNYNYTVAYFYKDPFPLIENNFFNHYNIIFLLILNRMDIDKTNKAAFLEYLQNIENKIKLYYNNNLNFLNNNNLLYLYDIKLEYDFKYEHLLFVENVEDDTFLRLRFSFKYMLKKNTPLDNILNEMYTIKSNEIKRNAWYKNNNKVKNIIKLFQNNFINNFIHYL